MNITQDLFHRWNAIRLNSSFEESVSAMDKLNELFPEEQAGGKLFNHFMEAAASVSQCMHFGVSGTMPLNESMETITFIRQLAYTDELFWPEEKEPFMDQLTKRKKVTILDFGCGLAQVSREMCRRLIAENVKVKLVLCDLAGFRRNFLLWATKQEGIDCDHLVCSSDRRVPILPKCDVVIVRNVLEHIRRPVKTLSCIHRVLNEGGFILGNFRNQREHALHCHPRLTSVRQYLRNRHYGYVYKWLRQKPPVTMTIRPEWKEKKEENEENEEAQ